MIGSEGQSTVPTKTGEPLVEEKSLFHREAENGEHRCKAGLL